MVVLIAFSMDTGAQASGEINDICTKAPDSALCQDFKKGINNTDDKDNPVLVLLTNVVNLLLITVGVLAVFMIIFSGFRYLKSNGESNKIAEAKNTLLYAIVGLLVAIFANRLIIFVLNRLYN